MTNPVVAELDATINRMKIILENSQEDLTKEFAQIVAQTMYQINQQFKHTIETEAKG